MIGTLFGSFLNLISDRFLKKEPILLGRSKCDYCVKSLKFTNLIPLFSFMFQKGKCSYCGKKLSFWYPVSELMTGAAFAAAFYLSNVFASPTLSHFSSFFFLLTIFSLYIILFLIDAKYMVIPDSFVLTGVISVIVFTVLIDFLEIISLKNILSNEPLGPYLIQAGFLNNSIKSYLKSYIVTLVSSLGISAFFYSLVAITKGRGMGGGDIKLGFLIGLVNKFPYNIFAVFLGFLIGAVFSMFLILLGKKSMKDTIAFGPFLIIGSLIILIYGVDFLTWYLSLF